MERKRKLEHSVSYIADGAGKWWKTVGEPQCVEDGIIAGRCQGVNGHKGCHWAYEPDGSYAYWINESDPDSIEEGVGAAIVPPDSDSYIHPIEKQKEKYTNFRATTEVVDKDVIQRLEKDDPPEEQASIDKPLSSEEYEELVEKGIIPKDQANEKMRNVQPVAGGDDAR
jgi:hypothetical protein